MGKTGRHRNEWEPDRALGTGTGSRDLSRCQTPGTMQAAMEVAQRYCSTELESYAQCVASNPSTWGVKCHDLKAQVSKCTSSHPVVRKIQAACASEFGAFETCLKENASAVLLCSSHMKGFLACAERVDTGLPITGVAQSTCEKS
uniref:Coiled-coil-helix-coiled-coil-helix domain-containing protein 5 n=1 Tax=Petromyzon marinus TaxID=7757 RepID=A0AAJ7WYQ4_PETMA|nr:coiled-coil-helix-coiled-coil-helix domain-containing protein 5 [Petromyzon marinus]